MGRRMSAEQQSLQGSGGLWAANHFASGSEGVTLGEEEAQGLQGKAEVPGQRETQGTAPC